MSIIDSLKRLERAGGENSRMTQKLKDAAQEVAKENTIKVSELSTELQEFFAGIREEIDFHSLSDKDKKAYIIRDLEEVQF